MDLNIFIALFTLFTGGHSLICYECNSATSYCVDKHVMCPYGTKCASISTSMNVLGNNVMNKKVKGCAEPQNCASGSINFGNVRLQISAHCCNNYLCNIRDVPDYTSNRPNGKQCYSCDGLSCFDKLNCLGNEDYCITAIKTISGLPRTIKGCASKLMCDAAPQANQDLTDMTCCQGNLCNTQKDLHDSEENLDTSDTSEENLDTKEIILLDNEKKLGKEETLPDSEEKPGKTKNLLDHEEKPHNSERNHRKSERNLRNSAKSITQNLLFLSWPFLSYIIYH